MDVALMVARLTGAALGLLAFTVTVISGMIVENPVTVTLSRSILALFIFCLLGMALGAAAQAVVAEHESQRVEEIKQRYREENEPGPKAPAPQETAAKAEQPAVRPAARCLKLAGGARRGASQAQAQAQVPCFRMLRELLRRGKLGVFRRRVLAVRPSLLTALRAHWRKDAEGVDAMRATNQKVDTTDLWREFKESADRSLRNRLMENYLPIVRYNAERISAKLPEEVDSDDLVSAGVFGLIDAIEAFDLERGVKFETYCSPRIRGAMLDELRSMDWVPRLVRSRAHKLERVAVALQSTLGRVPTEAEIAERLKLPPSEFEKLARDANAVTQVSPLAEIHRERLE